MVVHCALSSSHDTQLTTFLLTLANFVIILIDSRGVNNTPPICLYTTNQHNMEIVVYQFMSFLLTFSCHPGQVERQVELPSLAQC